ncbi:MAG TPA: hypothetical protein VKY59_21700 [Spirillospora sp.]|nr:hypothetical protein [Spirillospora sp.]
MAHKLIRLLMLARPPAEMEAMVAAATARNAPPVNPSQAPVRYPDGRFTFEVGGRQAATDAKLR